MQTPELAALLAPALPFLLDGGNARSATIITGDNNQTHR
jgi:hypothetical protein